MFSSPHQSESYGSSADPPEPAIPVCTLKLPVRYLTQFNGDGIYLTVCLFVAKQANDHADS
jgi:hypothetical protein